MHGAPASSACAWGRSRWPRPASSAGAGAVTHWRAFEPLAREHPEIALDESVLYVDHGDVLTSAGAASGLDACLHLVRTHLGARAANEVARQLVIAPHREGGQAQYIERPVPRHADDDPIGHTAAWALEHLSEPLPVERLARKAQMSTRSVHPHLPGVDWHRTCSMGSRAAGARGPAPSGEHGPGDRAGGLNLRLRQRHHYAPGLRTDTEHDAVGLPTPVLHCFSRPRRDVRPH